MGIRQDVFGLEKVYELQLEGRWSTREEVWLIPPPVINNNYSYEGGHYSSPGPTSGSNWYTNVQRMDMSNDTATFISRAQLIQRDDYRSGATVSSPGYGYFAGGGYPRITTVYRLDYANDNTDASPKGPLTQQRRSFDGTSNTSYGWIGGGSAPSSVTTVDRIDFSNDTATASLRGPLTRARYGLKAVGNQNYGYFAGGFPSTIDRVDYSNDTATASARGSLSGTTYKITTSGNADYGWIGDGYPGYGTRVQRIDYSNDTPNTVFRGNLTYSASARSGTGSANFGYAYGGGHPSGGAGQTTTNRINYSNDTATASPRGNMLRGIKDGLAISKTDNALNAQPSVFFLPSSTVIENVAPQGFDTGYFSGGYQPSNSPSFPSTVEFSSVARIDYSNDTTTVPARGSLNNVRYSAAGTGSSNFGYIGGGSPGGEQSTVERVDYSNDTATASPKGPLSNEVRAPQATGNVNFGYFNGGSGWDPSVGPVYFSSSSRIDYGNDTATAVIKGNLTRPLREAGATGNQSFGYFGGGHIAPPSPRVSSVDRINYSNDTATGVTKGPLTVRRKEIGATGNASFGYFGGGYNTIPGGNNWISTIDRIDYSNDTATASPKGPLSRTRGFGCATGDSSFGYFGGGEGNNNENLSALDRLDYSNDTATTVDKGPLSYSLRQSAASSSRANAMPLKGPGSLEVPVSFGAFSVSNPQGTDFGYFGGGNTPRLSTVDRIDYSNDTATASVKGPLSLSRGLLGAAGNASGGYFGGGVGITHYSTVDRVDYSNDTGTTAVKGPLDRTGYAYGATGNVDFGYWGGGRTPSLDSRVSRIDYSNDSGTASPKGPLSYARGHIAATGNQSFGYFAGGGPSPFPGGVSIVDRIDYSNDTATASPKGPLTIGIRNLAATGNANFGYVGGGLPPTTSLVDRIDYSNDTAAASPKGPLSEAKYNLYATGNSSFGYFAAGYNDGGTNLSLIDRVDYANDTATASPKGPLSVARVSGEAVSSREFGIPTENIVNYAAGTYATPTFGYIANHTPGPQTLERYDYSNDTADPVVKGTLSPGQPYGFSSTGNASFGYFGGGAPGPLSIVTRLNYLNDTGTPSPRGNLAVSVNYQAGYGNQNFGYYAGGTVSGSPSKTSTTQRIDYSNDGATASPKGPLNSTRSEILNAGFGTQDFGYTAGGLGNGDTASITRLDYSNDTATALTRGNTSGKWNKAATGNANFGYIASGYTWTSNVERLDYANDTNNTTVRCFLNDAVSLSTGFGDLDFGYFAGGHRPSGGPRTSIDRIDYANDTANAVIRANKGRTNDGNASIGARSFGFTAILGPSVVSNHPIQAHNPFRYGYFAGGAPGVGSNIQRIDYQNDTATAVEKGNLALATAESGSSSSSSFGYVFGGYSPRRSNVQRIEYANDTATALERGSLNHGRRHVKGTGNKDFGYVMGGDYPSRRSDVERIDYSNDSATPLIRGNLTAITYRNAATGNQNFGYVTINPSSILSTVNRIDYSNDSATAVVKGPLSVARTQLAATGNADFGYFGGGTTPSLASIVDRIDYSNDTATASPKGPLTYNGADLNATGNSSFGYFAGGWPAISTIDRINYSNDTATASTKGPLGTGARQTAGFSATECANPQ